MANTQKQLLLGFALLFSSLTSAQRIRKSHAGTGDGVDIIVVSPKGVMVAPVLVSVNIKITEGLGANLVRSDPYEYKLCYSLNGARPPLSYNLMLDPSKAWEGLPVLEDPSLTPGSIHTFESWVQKGSEIETTDLDGVEGLLLGYEKRTFTIQRTASAHYARLRTWEATVADLILKTSGGTGATEKHTDTRVGRHASGPNPRFVEIGTSYFDTLAAAHGLEDDGWVGISVEPIAEYLAALPGRKGLSKVNAMVCPQAGERTIYTFKQGPMLSSLGSFFAGMSSADPTFLWRSPEFRARVDLDAYRELLTTRTVRCVTFESLLDDNGHGVSSGSSSGKGKGGAEGGGDGRQTVFAHLKVDAEGADVGIVRAAVIAAAAKTAASGRASSSWPLRIDFESNHLHNHAALEVNTAAAATSNGVNQEKVHKEVDTHVGKTSGARQNEYPSSFTLVGFPEGDDREGRGGGWTAVDSTRRGCLDLAASRSSDQPPANSINGRFARLTGKDEDGKESEDEFIDGVPAYAHSNGRWIIHFSFALGHWILAETNLDGVGIRFSGEKSSNKLQIGRVGAHTDGEWAWALPWDNATAWFLPFLPFPGATEKIGSWQRHIDVFVAEVVFGHSIDFECNKLDRVITGASQQVAEAHSVACGDGPDLYPGSGGSEDLILELEDLGYACECGKNDCSCFTNPTRLAIHHPSTRAEF
mmetsp:Transcript_8525/g.16432  ORF Transcript_8525/g.16432 Transcript_8525/m.16432 type:complete len:700 (-) Transcript_8525:17-2116(-)